MDRGWIMGKTSLDKSKIKFLLLEGIHPSALKVLHDAGLLRREKRGTWVYYSARPEALTALGALFAPGVHA